jgi:hypothetical protein
MYPQNPCAKDFVRLLTQAGHIAPKQALLIRRAFIDAYAGIQHRRDPLTSGHEIFPISVRQVPEATAGSQLTPSQEIIWMRPRPDAPATAWLLARAKTVPCSPYLDDDD